MYNNKTFLNNEIIKKSVIHLEKLLKKVYNNKYIPRLHEIYKGVMQSNILENH